MLLIAVVENRVDQIDMSIGEHRLSEERRESTKSCCRVMKLMNANPKDEEYTVVLDSLKESISVVLP